MPLIKKRKSKKKKYKKIDKKMFKPQLIIVINLPVGYLISYMF
jgi:hypothetical protein